jgi:hypothetical protein
MDDPNENTTTRTWESRVSSWAKNRNSYLHPEIAVQGFGPPTPESVERNQVVLDQLKQDWAKAKEGIRFIPDPNWRYGATPFLLPFHVQPEFMKADADDLSRQQDELHRRAEFGDLDARDKILKRVLPNLERNARTVASDAEFLEFRDKRIGDLIRNASGNEIESPAVVRRIVEAAERYADMHLSRMELMVDPKSYVELDGPSADKYLDWIKEKYNAEGSRQLYTNLGRRLVPTEQVVEKIVTLDRKQRKALNSPLGIDGEVAGLEKDATVKDAWKLIQKKFEKMALNKYGIDLSTRLLAEPVSAYGDLKDIASLTGLTPMKNMDAEGNFHTDDEVTEIEGQKYTNESLDSLLAEAKRRQRMAEIDYDSRKESILLDAKLRKQIKDNPEAVINLEHAFFK